MSENLIQQLLNVLTTSYHFSIQSLSKLLKVDEETVYELKQGNLEYYYNYCSCKNQGLLISFLSILTDGFELVDSEMRIKAIIKDLSEKYCISLETLSKYTNIPLKELDEYLNAEKTLSDEMKGELGVVALFLNLCIERYHAEMKG